MHLFGDNFERNEYLVSRDALNETWDNATTAIPYNITRIENDRKKAMNAKVRVKFNFFLNESDPQQHPKS